MFATARYDRFWNTDGEFPIPLRLHQEDFGQTLGIASFAKYEPREGHYLKAMFDLLRRCSSDPIQDQLKLWDIVVFDFLLGNTDAHVKNFSLLRGKNPKHTRLAPAYDLVSTTVYKISTRDMAFRIGGHISLDEIKRATFADAAREIGLGQRMAMQRFDAMADKFERALRQSAEELADAGYESAIGIMEDVLKTGGIRNI